MTLTTEHGPLDLCFAPAGFPDGYASLSEHASVIVVAAVDLPVASLEDVVARGVPQPGEVVPTTGGEPAAARVDCQGVDWALMAAEDEGFGGWVGGRSSSYRKSP